MKDRIKQLLLIALAVVCVCSMSACGSSKKGESFKDEDEEKKALESLQGEWGQFEPQENSNDMWCTVMTFGEDGFYAEYVFTTGDMNYMSLSFSKIGSYELTKDKINISIEGLVYGTGKTEKQEETCNYGYELKDNVLTISYTEDGSNKDTFYKDNWQKITNEIKEKTTWYAQEQVIAEYEDYIVD